MDNTIKNYDKQILEMMSNPSWWIDKQKKRKIDLLRSARKVYRQSSISKKMGSLLLWQQVIEQFLKEIIELSVFYIKAEICKRRANRKTRGACR